ncbi:hypothetical protein F5884DRAFT_786550 [Xylogone sp. PMI_703]|nr:hypothetical protein F5884DRAFT_786550 [Xylogone sp. PMI_703]
MTDILNTLGCNAQIVKNRRFMTDVREVWASQPGFEKVFGNLLPTSTLLEVHSCTRPEARVGIEAWAATESDQEISLPPAKGLFPSATIADKKTRLVVLNGIAKEIAPHGISSELAACINMVNTNITESGGSSDNILKISLYLRNMRFLDECLEFLSKQYTTNMPVVVPVAANKFQHEGTSVKIEATFAVHYEKFIGDASLSGDLTKSQLILSGAAAIPIYNHKKAYEAYSYQPEQSAAAQTQICLANYENVLRTAGFSKKDI